MIGYKGFDKNFRCRGFQYQVGETYRFDGDLAVCESGFHFCDNPLAVWEFYPPVNGNRFALVEATGTVVKHDDMHKFCTDELKILKELSPDDLIQAVPDTATNTGDRSAATNSGLHSIAIVTGAYSKAKGALGCWLVLTERKNKEILSVKAVKVDGVSILPDVFYTLKDGQPVIADDN